MLRNFDIPHSGGNINTEPVSVNTGKPRTVATVHPHCPPHHHATAAVSYPGTPPHCPPHHHTTAVLLLSATLGPPLPSPPPCYCCCQLPWNPPPTALPTTILLQYCCCQLPWDPHCPPHHHATAAVSYPGTPTNPPHHHTTAVLLLSATLPSHHHTNCCCQLPWDPHYPPHHHTTAVLLLSGHRCAVYIKHLS